MEILAFIPKEVTVWGRGEDVGAPLCETPPRFPFARGPNSLLCSFVSSVRLLLGFEFTTLKLMIIIIVIISALVYYISTLGQASRGLSHLIIRTTFCCYSHSQMRKLRHRQSKELPKCTEQWTWNLDSGRVTRSLCVTSHVCCTECLRKAILVRNSSEGELVLFAHCMDGTTETRQWVAHPRSNHAVKHRMCLSVSKERAGTKVTIGLGAGEAGGLAEVEGPSPRFSPLHAHRAGQGWRPSPSVYAILAAVR